LPETASVIKLVLNFSW